MQADAGNLLDVEVKSRWELRCRGKLVPTPAAAPGGCVGSKRGEVQVPAAISPSTCTACQTRLSFPVPAKVAVTPILSARVAPPPLFAPGRIPFRTGPFVPQQVHSVRYLSHLAFQVFAIFPPPQHRTFCQPHPPAVADSSLLVVLCRLLPTVAIFNLGEATTS